MRVPNNLPPDRKQCTEQENVAENAAKALSNPSVLDNSPPNKRQYQIQVF